ncbi:aminoglycoside adenylyltransferase domain-containing protein [Sutcliffiella sp. NPDC057660]|uniref:aminoglycoside adenylyltransferase domain-containing protein n=1 Tax=Sutcliffiella sp. NPDC057660 TaxID=3346199 RepID=UPI0036C5A30E
MNRIRRDIKIVIDEFIERVERSLPGFIQDFYIYGSISLGAFQNKFSDIDFIALINQHPKDDDLQKLKDIHRHMQKKFSHTTLDGYYLVKEEMEAENQRAISSHYFSEGKFKGKRSFSKDSIDAFQLKKYGIIIKGQQLDYSVDFDIVLKNQKDNINTYWQNWLDSCKRFPSINFFGSFVSIRSIEWGVLGVTRLFYTIREKDMTSKVGAGEYALGTVPEKWHKIIEEAIRFRKGEKQSLYRSVRKRRADALAYMEYVIGGCNAEADKHGRR